MTISPHQSEHYLPFIGTLFLFIAVANLLNIVPGYMAPTGSLSTTTALAICVFIAVPLYGITQQGALPYLRHYLRPTWQWSTSHQRRRPISINKRPGIADLRQIRRAMFIRPRSRRACHGSQSSWAAKRTCTSRGGAKCGAVVTSSLAPARA